MNKPLLFLVYFSMVVKTIFNNDNRRLRGRIWNTVMRLFAEDW